jgi:hypothetical protein
MQITSKKSMIALLIVAAILTAALGSFIWRAHADRRSVPGHIVRYLRGESGADQDLNDLSEDICNIPSLDQLQPWGVETLRLFRLGKLQTNGFAQNYWDEPPAVKLARQERPKFIRDQWGETNEYGEDEPEIFIVCGTNKQPEAVGIGWYMYGIRIGPPEYRIDYASNYYCPFKQVKPGVYVYGNYK